MAGALRAAVGGGALARISLVLLVLLDNGLVVALALVPVGVLGASQRVVEPRPKDAPAGTLGVPPQRHLKVQGARAVTVLEADAEP